MDNDKSEDHAGLATYETTHYHYEYGELENSEIDFSLFIKKHPRRFYQFQSEIFFAGGNKKDLYPRHVCLDKGLVDR